MINVTYYNYLLKDGEDKKTKEHNLGLLILYGLLKEKYNYQSDYESLLKSIKLNEYGKPYFNNIDNLYFNISHCDGYVAVAISSKEIGIDIERVSERKENMMKKMLTEKEFNDLKNSKNNLYFQFFKYWTLKESYLKWCGRGFSLDPKSVEFEFNENGVVCIDKKISCVVKEITSSCLLALVYEGKEEINYESY